MQSSTPIPPSRLLYIFTLHTPASGQICRSLLMCLWHILYINPRYHRHNQLSVGNLDAHKALDFKGGWDCWLLSVSSIWGYPLQVRLIQRWEFIKEKQESRRTRKHAFDQESDHEKRKKIAKREREKTFFFFLIVFLVESVFFFFFS